MIVITINIEKSYILISLLINCFNYFTGENTKKTPIKIAYILYKYLYILEYSRNRSFYK